MLQRLGFTLREARDLLAIRQQPAAACPKALRRAEAKLREVTEKIRTLQRVRRELERLTEACGVAACPRACPLLAVLGADSPKREEP